MSENTAECRDDCSTTLATLAWVLATCPKAELRDGARAVALARQAVELSGSTDTFAIESLAAAFAECGDFEFAIEWQHRAMLLSSGDYRSDAQESLALYEARRPDRESLRNSLS